MTLVQLEYIIAVARYGQFSIAAEKCFVTQPTLSMQIQKLEDELDVLIFDRSQQPITPTLLGKKIIEQAQQALFSAQRIKDTIKEERNLISGDLNIGIIPTIASYLLPLFFPPFIRHYPHLKLHIDELLTDQVVERLQSGDLDVGIISTPLNEKGIREIPLYYEPFVVYAAPSHALFAKEKIESADVSLDDMWLLTDGHCFRSHAINLCGIDNQNIQSLAMEYKTGSLESLLRIIIQQQEGYTLLPYLATLDLDDRKRALIRYFADPVPTREIALVVRDSFCKDKVIELLKNEIITNLPAELNSEESGMLVNWK